MNTNKNTIDSNKVNHISKNVFSFEKSSDSLFNLDLTNLPLNDASFESRAFCDLERPTKINLNARDHKR